MASKHFVLVAILALSTLVVACSSPTTQEEFIETWTGRLLALEDPADTAGLPGVDWPDGVFVRKFGSGEWIAVRAVDDEYSHASGDEAFDATVFVDSEGAVNVSTSVHVCGRDALNEYLGTGPVEADSLEDFYAALESTRGVQWELRELNRPD